MTRKSLVLAFLASALLPGLASASAWSYLTSQQATVATPAKTLPLPVCTVSATSTAPGGRITFSPSSPNSVPPQYYTWKGQVTATTSGAAIFSFPYAGVYTFILEADAWDGTYAQVACPSITVKAEYAASSTMPGATTNVFPFSDSASQAQIPKTPTPYPDTCLNLEQDLSAGYEDDVANPADGLIYNLQLFLKTMGFLKVNPTGYFGSLTTAAVKAYQKSYDIAPTGYVGPLTRAKIKAHSCLS